jgi:hypothetical protein
MPRCCAARNNIVAGTATAKQFTQEESRRINPSAKFRTGRRAFGFWLPGPPGQQIRWNGLNSPNYAGRAEGKAKKKEKIFKKV